MEQKVQIDSIDTAKFSCPEYNREKIMQLSQYNITKLKTKVKCKCGGQMIIEKLNSKGLKLRTSIEQSFLPGLKIFLEFVLDDAKH